MTEERTAAVATGGQHGDQGANIDDVLARQLRRSECNSVAGESVKAVDNSLIFSA